MAAEAGVQGFGSAHALIRRIERLESEIDALLPSDKLHRKPEPDLRAALDRYSEVVLEGAGEVGSGSSLELTPSEQVLASRPLFIMGLHRSGTTLMQRLLDGHPELVVLPSEGAYLTNVYPALRRIHETSRVAQLVRLWIPRLIISGNQPPFWLLGRTGSATSPYLDLARVALQAGEQAATLFGRHSPFEPYLSLVSAFRRSRLDSSRTLTREQYWVDKTPLNEFHADALSASFPEARFIHVVRDPRAVFASRKQLNIDVLGSPGGLLRHVVRIRRSFRRALRNQALLGSHRYWIVRYEDLVNSREGTMASIRTFLGIADDRALTGPTVMGRPCIANSSYRFPFVPGQIAAFSENHFRKVLTSAEKEFIESLTGRYARLMGYPLGGGGPKVKLAALAQLVVGARLRLRE